VKPADTNRKSTSNEGACQIHSPWKLIRLNTNESDQGFPTFSSDLSHDRSCPNTPIGLVVGVQPDVYIAAEHVTPPRIVSEGEKAS
jgi:hypothetical protein